MFFVTFEEKFKYIIHRARAILQDTVGTNTVANREKTRWAYVNRWHKHQETAGTSTQDIRQVANDADADKTDGNYGNQGQQLYLSQASELLDI